VTRPLGQHRHRLEDNIRMNLRKLVGEGVNWKHLAQDRDQVHAVVITVINLLFP
jgi:hypothetical protein